MQTRLLIGLACAGLCLAPLVKAEEGKQKKPEMSEDMRRAIAFERAKDRAAARQARLEARHPSVTNSTNSANRADESATSGREVKDPGEPQARLDKK